MQALTKRPQIASAAVAIVWLSSELPHSPNDGAVSYVAPFHPSITLCEATHSNKTSNISIHAPSGFQKALASLHLKALPLPRRLLPNDPVFSDSTLKRGLRQRSRDESSLKILQEQVQKAVQERKDMAHIRSLHEQFCAIAYGSGVTPQEREDFVVRYGCTGWTDDVLDALFELGDSRGYVEIGAGNGQWARALTDRYKQELLNTSSNNKMFEYVLAYDDMSELPLSPEIYHEHTQPAHDYFYSRVQKCDSIQAVLGKWPCRGRILLLVYPPPGPMAMETVKTYAELGPENDTVVFVGEGRGGANANNELFDYFESGDWAILRVLPVKPQPGGKGYEKLYILQRFHHEGNDESKD
jgi:hypothetical protein